jgi:hypothetical protein
MCTHGILRLKSYLAFDERGAVVMNGVPGLAWGGAGAKAFGVSTSHALELLAFLVMLSIPKTPSTSLLCMHHCIAALSLLCAGFPRAGKVAR